MYFAKASRRVRGGIVVVVTTGIVAKRVGNGGGSEANEMGDVMDEKESNTIIGAVGEVEARWIEMSMIGGDEIGSS